MRSELIIMESEPNFPDDVPDGAEELPLADSNPSAEAGDDVSNNESEAATAEGTKSLLFVNTYPLHKPDH